MRSIDQTVATATGRYKRVWRDALLDQTEQPQRFSFALDPPSAATIVELPADVAAWLTAWRTFGDHHNEITLRQKVIRTTRGQQPVYTHLDVPDLTALACLDADNLRHWHRARDRWARMQPIGAPDTVKPWLTQIVDLAEPDFELLLSAAAWFRATPRSGLTIRRVPVPGMHTKWLARHRRLVIALLGHTVAADSDPDVPVADGGIEMVDLPAGELDALGLRPIPPEADVILADPADRVAAAGLRHIRSPIDELAQLPLQPSCVLVVENKEAALSISDTEGLVIIHSLGNHTDVLTQLPWLPPEHTIYWGDLDRHGFTLLSRAKAAVPHLRSMLMSADTVHRYRHLAVTEALTRYDLPDATLDGDESAALSALLTDGGFLRVEQERIPVEDAEEALEGHRRRRGKPTGS